MECYAIRMKLKLIWFVIVALSLPVAAQTARPDPLIHHVVIISVDGLRPDLALRRRIFMRYSIPAAIASGRGRRPNPSRFHRTRAC
jgi:predicted AlkP superfamily pyrophosphatase or phosphodiesterase